MWKFVNADEPRVVAEGGRRLEQLEMNIFFAFRTSREYFAGNEYGFVRDAMFGVKNAVEAALEDRFARAEIRDAGFASLANHSWFPNCGNPKLSPRGT